MEIIKWVASMFFVAAMVFAVCRLKDLTDELDYKFRMVNSRLEDHIMKSEEKVRAKK